METLQYGQLIKTQFGNAICVEKNRRLRNNSNTK